MTTARTPPPAPGDDRRGEERRQADRRHTDGPDGLSRLRRRLDRERKARREAERISERAMRDLYLNQAHLQLVNRIATAANEATTVTAALETTLREVCRHAGWPVGHAYLVERGCLESSGVWHFDDSEAYTTLRNATEQTRFAPGVGLPGRILETGRPLWIDDIDVDANFPRSRGARASGVVCAIGVPVIVGGEVVGVLEFFAAEATPPDPSTIELITSVSTQLGRVIERHRAAATLRRRATELERSNRELEQYAYVASHDLQEPARMVASYMALLKRRFGDQLPREAHQFIDYAIGGAKRMQDLIDDLLSYSRVSRSNPPMLPTDLQTVLDQALANLTLAVEESGATITVSSPLPTVAGDRGLLVQLLQNLVANAIKFRAPDQPPRVEIGAIDRDGRWELTVTDNGIGIDPRFADRVFDVFQRLHPQDAYDGNGIGLAICRGIVERHNGRIWVGPPPAQGTSIHFTLPAA